jgi:hypothetical protein
MSKRSWLRADVALVAVALVGASIGAWVIIRNDQRERDAERRDELVERSTPTLGAGGLQTDELTRRDFLELLRVQRADDDSRLVRAVITQLRHRCDDLDIDRVLDEVDLEELFPEAELARATGAGCVELDMPDGTTWTSPALRHVSRDL